MPRRLPPPAQEVLGTEAVSQRSHGGIQRALSLLDGKRDLFGETWPDMVVGAHTEGIEAQRLLALASHGNHD